MHHIFLQHLQPQASVNISNSAADAEIPQTTTTYYLSDHLGSGRMLLAAGGWPVSSDTYYPFGQEPVPPADNNHYKFTGLERDAETGLDHATFRQYASFSQKQTGRIPRPSLLSFLTP